MCCNTCDSCIFTDRCVVIHATVVSSQIDVLEKEREQLADNNQKNENLIQDLNILNGELRHTEKALCDQMKRRDIEEEQMQSHLTDLIYQVEELESTVRQLQSSELSLKSQLDRHQKTEMEMTTKVDNAFESQQAGEQKLKKRINELEQDRRKLSRKVEELADRIGDLEEVELVLKQKIRHMENTETSLRNRIGELERFENDAKIHIAEMELLKESLSEQVHQMEEEKSNVIFEISDLRFERDTYSREIGKLSEELSELKELQRRGKEVNSSLRQSINDSTAREKKLELELLEYVSRDKMWQENIALLEEAELKMAARLQQLESDLRSAVKKVVTTDLFKPG